MRVQEPAAKEQGAESVTFVFSAIPLFFFASLLIYKKSPKIMPSNT
jgi:hypothetical protein